MIRVQTVAVAFRLLAIWFVAQAVTLLTTIAAYGLLHQSAGVGLPMVVNTIALLVLAVLTWSFSPALAGKALAGLDSEDRPGAGSQEVQRVALRTFGAILAALGVCGLAYSIVHLSVTRQGAGTEDVFFRKTELQQGLADFSRSLTQTVIGVGLVLGKAGLSAVWDKVRGTHDYDSVDEPEGPAE